MRRPGNSGGVVSELQVKVRAGDASELVDYLNIEYQIDPRNIYFSDGRTCLTEVKFGTEVLLYTHVDSPLSLPPPPLLTPHISNPTGEQ